MLQDMYANWPFFTSTLDLVEMVLAKADSRWAGREGWGCKDVW